MRKLGHNRPGQWQGAIETAHRRRGAYHLRVARDVVVDEGGDEWYVKASFVWEFEITL